VVRSRVLAAREIQGARGISCNAEIDDRQLDELTAVETEGMELLGRAVDRMRLSVRAVRRVLRVARTIADLADETATNRIAIAEALQLRVGDGG
jgi:magnesium chelatase family protein